MKHVCPECDGEGTIEIECPTCDGEGEVEEDEEDKPVQLQIPGVDWSQYEHEH